MKTERSWRVEVKWCLSAFAALMASLLVFALVKVVISVATANAAELAASGITDRYAEAISRATAWPLAAVFGFYPFLIAGALWFRLLVPTFAGAPPRVVGVIVVAAPVALGAQLIGQDLGTTLLMTGVAILWALMMPMPKETLLSVDSIKGGAVVGLAFGALALSQLQLDPGRYISVLPLPFAIVWCIVRLYRGASLEVTATALCTAVMPALFIATQLPHATLNKSAIELVVEVMSLGVLALFGFARELRWQDPDGDDDASEDDEDGLEAAQS